MKRAILFIHGNKPKKERVEKIVKKSDTIICADGGAQYAVSCGLTPDIVLGDEDSLSLTLKKKLQKKQVQWVSYPTNKDMTDSEIAISYALDHGFSDIVLFGVIGDRIDHMLGTLFYLFYHTQGARVYLVEDTQNIYLLKDSDITIKGKKGDYVSLLPLSDSKNSVTTKGLRYSLYNDTLPFGKTLGISNELLSQKATISVSKASLLVIHTLS